MSKAIVFIDGSNFYHKQRDLVSQLPGKYRLMDFRFQDFCRWLVKPNDVAGVRYYVGAVRQQGGKKTKQMFADQQRLLARLQQQHIHVTLGQLIQHPDKSLHEKGVDVRLAVEMIRLARNNEYDIAYLLSSDTDLVAAVEEVQSFGKKVQYVGIAKGQSFGLTKVSDDVRLLRPEDIVPFLPESLI